MRKVSSLGLATVLPWRAFVCVMMSIMVLSACVPASVKQMRAGLPRHGAFDEVYYVEFDSFLPDWYRMYSVANGVSKSARACTRSPVRFIGTQRFSIVNCSRASQAQLDALTVDVQRAIDSVEGRFGNAIHVVNVKLELFDKDDGFSRSFTHLVKARNLTLEMAVVYDVERPELSERRIVEVVAHELFHIARHIVRRSDIKTPVLRFSEETRAELFGYCIDSDVFGSLESRAFDAGRHFDPRWFIGIPEGYESARGSIRASSVLAELVGGGREFSTDAQEADFRQLCLRLVQ